MNWPSPIGGRAVVSPGRLAVAGPGSGLGELKVSELLRESGWTASSGRERNAIRNWAVSHVMELAGHL